MGTLRGVSVEMRPAGCRAHLAISLLRRETRRKNRGIGHFNICGHLAAVLLPDGREFSVNRPIGRRSPARGAGVCGNHAFMRIISQGERWNSVILNIGHESGLGRTAPDWRISDKLPLQSGTFLPNRRLAANLPRGREITRDYSVTCFYDANSHVHYDPRTDQNPHQADTAQHTPKPNDFNSISVT